MLFNGSYMKVLMIVNDTNFAWNLRRELLFSIREHGYDTTLLAHKLLFVDDFLSHGIKLIDQPIDRRGTNPFSDIKLFMSYYKILKKERPDIVLSNNTKPNIYAGIVCSLLKIKYMANVTGLGTSLGNPGKFQKLTIHLYKKGVKKANVLFFQNSENRKFFEVHNMMPKHANIVILPGSGVNLDTHPLLDWHDGKIHFLYAARIMKEKGIDLFLTAARRFASDDVIFDVCGQCDDPKYLSLLNSEKCIVYHGLQKDLTPYYEQCSCFLYPSYYPEGMSNVCIEAAACGRPVIAADKAGCRETVDDGITGYIIPANDENAIIDAVERFLSLSAEQRKEMGIAGRRKMEKEFDRNIVIDTFINEMEALF
jgi:galacturonosyltransferase